MYHSFIRPLRRIAAGSLGIAALLVSSCTPENRPSTTLAAPPAAPVIAPALWTVSDADTTIYLFGTIHVLSEPVDWNRGAVADALAGSKELVTEAIIDSPDALQKSFLAKGMRTDGKSLRDTMTAENRAKYEAALAALGLPVGAFDPMKPWFPAIALPTLVLNKAGYDLKNGVEAQLTAYAETRGMKRGALETPEMQMDAFDAVPPDAQLSYLADVITQIPETSKVVGQLVEAWKTGQSDELAKILNEDEDDPQLREELLYKRNTAWAKWIKARLDQPGAVFVAVGAGHLAGPGSVLDDLAALGITSRRVQ